MKWIPVILLFSLVFVFGIHTLTWITVDLGLHLTLGKIILASHHVIKTNYFSYTNPNFPWYNDTWVSKVLLYLGYLYFGLKGLIIIKAAVLTAAFTLAFFAFFRKETLFFSIGAGLAAIFIFIERTDVKPEMFSFLILGWFLFVVFGKPKLIWTLPIAQLIWINTHIYFFLGPFIYILYLLDQHINHKPLTLTDRRACVGYLLLAVNLINPYGLTGALYPFSAFSNYGYQVGENFSPFSRVKLGYPAMTTYALVVGIILGAITFVANLKNIRKNITGAGLFIASAILATTMLRNMPIFALSFIPISVKNIYEAGWSLRYNRARAAIFSVILATLIYAVMVNQVYTAAGIEGRAFGLKIPVNGQAAVSFVRKHHLKGPIFNNYDIGNYLIWQLPEEKVFIDGRPEAYPADFVQNVYVAMQNDPAVFEKYSEQYDLNYIFWDASDITTASRRFIKSLQQNPKWPLVYQDPQFLIFVKNTPKNMANFR